MSNISVINFENIDIQKIKFEPPEKVKGGSFMSVAHYNNEPIYIQTPRLLSNKGIVRSDIRCNLELEFDKDHWKFYEFITNVDDYNILQIQNNSKEWFSKEFPLDVVEEFYKTPIKIGRGKKPPSLKIKIPIVKGDLGCSIYNSNNNIITYNDINIGSKILSVLKFQGLRFLKQQVICEWVPLQIKVFQKGQDSVYLINDNLLSDIDTNNSNIIDNSNLDFEVTTNLNIIDNHYLESNENNLESNENNLESTDNNIESNENNLESNENNLESNENNLEYNENNLDSNENNLESNENNLDSNENNLEYNENNLDSNENNLESNENNLDSNENNLEYNENNLDSNENNLESNENNLDSNENNLEIHQLKLKYEKMINERDLIINSFENKFKQLKDFIN